ncbi:hypothetical protein SAMN02745196_02826 [Clostridium collagenovorans DSM 3089]|uniref:Uncharacterized protein n=1 Tax=Clostridium collagenovorans DSM 3089 TaxID=1121306 RepID=A0A1M5YD12_9CLOT|nr:hypothetical protein [Clostridium collagenovorans]SHI09789.1 hypothetical protein SAMN02745196_02826 [Clostridium collagenovorans DSM 3089]
MRQKLDLEIELPIKYTLRQRKIKNASKVLGFGLIFSGIGFGVGCLVYGFSKK